MVMVQIGSFFLFLSICLIGAFIGGYIVGKKRK